MIMRIKVGIFDEHEIFAHGVESVLREDPAIESVTRLIAEASSLDVAVVSAAQADNEAISCPMVVCLPARGIPAPIQRRTHVFAELPRETMTPHQLLGAVTAAVAGLRIQSTRPAAGPLDERGRCVLQLLASGADTREISDELGYSERTIKGAIQQIERALGARSRAQAVALAVRMSLI